MVLATDSPVKNLVSLTLPSLKLNISQCIERNYFKSLVMMLIRFIVTSDQHVFL